MRTWNFGNGAAVITRVENASDILAMAQSQHEAAARSSDDAHPASLRQQANAALADWQEAKRRGVTIAELHKLRSRVDRFSEASRVPDLAVRRPP